MPAGGTAGVVATETTPLPRRVPSLRRRDRSEAAMAPDMPHILEIAIVVLFGVAALIAGAASVVAAVTMLRRQVRHGRISARNEGWGGRDHPNQKLTETGAAHPVLDLIMRYLTTAKSAGQPDEPPGTEKGPHVKHNDLAKPAA
jgi:hypothetical protein